MDSTTKKGIAEFAIIAIIVATSASLVWYWGLRTYSVTGTITELNSTPDGEYIVHLNNNVTLTVESNLWVRSNLSDKQLFESLKVGASYNFSCWGETPHIYQAK